MIDMVVVKKDMLCCVQDVRIVRGVGRGLSDHHVLLCKARLVGAWIKRREGLVGARRIRSEKLREDWYREGYARSHEGKRVKGDGDNVKLGRCWQLAMKSQKKDIWKLYREEKTG